MADTKNDIKQWLEKALTKENLKNISVEILGNSEKGDGYLGDIVFVKIIGTHIITNNKKKFDLILKCSKKSQSLRDSAPVKEAFYNEILMYNEILPEIKKLQQSKSVKNVFNNYPKYYGHFTNETTEVIVLENVKNLGYDVWDKTKTLTKKHLLMVVEKYGQLHACSGALKKENPQKFQEFDNKLGNVMKKFCEVTNIEKMMSAVIDEACCVLKNCCDENVLEKLKLLKSQVNYIYRKMTTECKDEFRAIGHGDCWNNNFMWKHNENDKTSPEELLIIDWQLSSAVTPIVDLSYFLFSTISEEGLNDFNTILDAYYNSFAKTLKELGYNAENIYKKEEFLSDWKKYCRYGFLMGLNTSKFGFANKDNLPDLEKSANEGLDAAESFVFKCSDKEGYGKRIKPVVEFVVKNNLIDL